MDLASAHAQLHESWNVPIRAWRGHLVGDTPTPQRWLPGFRENLHRRAAGLLTTRPRSVLAPMLQDSSWGAIQC